jgi:hypothetical protein
MTALETQPLQQQQGVRRRCPLRAVQLARPTPIGILKREKTGTASLGGDPSLLGQHLLRMTIDQILQNVPSHGRITIHQPFHDGAIIGWYGVAHGASMAAVTVAR